MKAIERGYKHAKTQYEKHGEKVDMSDPKYALCGEDFRKGVEMYLADIKNNLKK